jgi:hypothetical protein
MQFNKLINSILKEDYSVEIDPDGNKRYYILDANIKKGCRYTGEILMLDFGCDWIEEEDENTYFIIKDDKEVVKDEQDLLAKQAYKDHELGDIINF